MQSLNTQGPTKPAALEDLKKPLHEDKFIQVQVGYVWTVYNLSHEDDCRLITTTSRSKGYRLHHVVACVYVCSCPQQEIISTSTKDAERIQHEKAKVIQAEWRKWSAARKAERERVEREERLNQLTSTLQALHENSGSFRCAQGELYGSVPVRTCLAAAVPTVRRCTAAWRLKAAYLQQSTDTSLQVRKAKALWLSCCMQDCYGQLPRPSACGHRGASHGRAQGAA